MSIIINQYQVYLHHALNPANLHHLEPDLPVNGMLIAWQNFILVFFDHEE